MLRAVVSQHEGIDSRTLICRAIADCSEQLGGESPSVGVLFASDALDHKVLLDTIIDSFPDIDLIGCCSAGEISSQLGFSDDSLCLMLICADESVSIAGGYGEAASKLPEKAIDQALVMARSKLSSTERLCLLFGDGIVGKHIDLLTVVGQKLHEDCAVFGGMSGLQRYNYETGKTCQFYNRQVLTDSCVMLLFSGEVQIAHTLCNSWYPIGPRAKITGTEGLTVTHIEGRSALGFYQHYLGPHAHPAYENPFAVYDGEQEHFYLRVPTGYDPYTGGISFPVPLPQGAEIQITESSKERAIADINNALVNSRVVKDDFVPNLAFVFSCDIRKHILGTGADREIASIRKAISPAVPIIGFYTLGEIAPLYENARSIVHHCTLVTLLVQAGSHVQVSSSKQVEENRSVIDGARQTMPISLRESERHIEFIKKKLQRERYYRKCLEDNKELNLHLFRQLNQELKEKNDSLADLNMSLERIRGELEERVEARTRELALANEKLLREIEERERVFEEQEGMRAQLHQANKMEALGTLAGGIAHDFNNLLTPIIGYTEMITRAMLEDDGNREMLCQVLQAGKRAKELVQQILLFSRKKAAPLQPIQLQLIIKEAIKLLQSTLPKSIAIDRDIGSDCGYVLADPTQIHQVLMNLCVNGAQAMEGEGGMLTIRLREIELQRPVSHQMVDAVPPGHYLQLTVSDTGLGMDRESLQRIFEPYYTTKDVGKGTGMGLAVSQAIIRNHCGYIDVTSTPGEGTDFVIYLPLLADENENDEVSATFPEMPGGTEHILFVDDEPMIVEMSQTMLRQLGYSVTAVTDCIKALSIFTRAPQDIDLVITDQSMPGLSGFELAEKMLKIRPTIPILLCTGFSAAISEKKALEVGIKACLTKPLGMMDIAAVIRRTLDH